MKLFQRNTPKDTSDDHMSQAQNSTTETATVNTNDTTELTPEEVARQWFKLHYNTDFPEELKRLFRHWTAIEAKRQKVGEHILDANEQRRIQDGLRLYQTKLTNINQTLESLQAQKEWIYKFDLLNKNLNKYRQAFFETNKEYNSHLQEIKELEQFESYESILANYEHIKLYKAARKKLLSCINSTNDQITRLEHLSAEAKKDFESKKKIYTDYQDLVLQQQERLAEGYKLEANLVMLNDNINELNDILHQTDKLLTPLLQSATEEEADIRKTCQENNELQIRMQNMDSMQKMIEKGDVIITKLKFLSVQKNRKEQLRLSLEEAIRKQTEQNNKLNKLFTESKDIDAQINALQSELQVHLKSIVGMNSYMLQQRAMTLKSRKDQLTSAARLWKQITQGYQLIDEKNQEIVRMQLHTEHLKHEISPLETEVAGLQKQCEELKYAYTLSKSQDVMQLRKDLREGTNCCVCGATHHPYHSDTLLEQSKLIGDMKSEYEQAANELKNKIKILEGLKHELATEEGRLEIAYQALITFKKIQQEHIGNWSNFTSLDRTFNECSPSSNHEARRSMLQQLIERTEIDAENAQKELDNFNFHQSNINALNEKLSTKEQEKSDIIVRLNEVNTGCQVLAYRVDQLQQTFSRANEHYSSLYEEVDKLMCISNWFKIWSESPENLYINIQQQMELYDNTAEKIRENQTKELRQRARLDFTQNRIKQLQRQKRFLINEIERLSEFKEQNRSQLAKLFINSDIKTYNQQLLNKLIYAENEKDTAGEKQQSILAELQFQKGFYQHQQEEDKELETSIAQENSTIDLWIRTYNSQHSPIQFSEIEHTFLSKRDWNTLRQDIRELTLKNRVASARADDARLALVAHQINALSPGADKENRTASLNAEIAKLETEQKDIQMHIAGLRAQLEAHELSIQKLAACQDDLVTQ